MFKRINVDSLPNNSKLIYMNSGYSVFEIVTYPYVHATIDLANTLVSRRLDNYN